MANNVPLCQISVNFENIIDFRTRFAQNYMNDKFCNNKQNHNKHVAMYPCMEFQSIWKTSNFGTKFFQENMTDKNFEKKTH